MSEPVTALNGAVYNGGIATVSEVALQGMITLRGDLSGEATARAVKAGIGAAVPGPREAAISGNTGVAWMSPDELLILCTYDEVTAVLAKVEKELSGDHALAVNVSDARASFRIKGGRAREVLGKLCPVELSPEKFKPGMFRRTRMAQVAAAIWPCGEDEIQVICFRSQAQYVFDLLCVAAQPGSEVGAA